MAEKKYLDKLGLTYLVNKIKALIPTKTSDLTNDSDYTTNDLIIVGNEEDITENTKLLIEDDEPDIVSEVVNSLEGNEIAKAPSVRAVNEVLENINDNLDNIGTILSTGFLRGIYSLTTAPRTITNASTAINLEYRVHFKTQLEAIFPKNNKFTRKYILLVDCNSDENRCTLYLGDTALINFLVWTEQNNSQIRTEYANITTQIENAGYGHLYVKAQTNGWAYINKSYILVYDIPKEE